MAFAIARSSESIRWWWRQRRLAWPHELSEEDVVAECATFATHRLELFPLIDGKHFS